MISPNATFKIGLIFFVLNFTFLPVSGQPPAHIDSLRNELNHANDPARVKILYDISFAWSSVNPDSGVYYGEQSVKLAAALNDTAGRATALGILGINYRVKADYLMALEYSIEALSVYKSLNKDNSIAAMCANISSIYMELSNYEIALQYALEALSYYNASENNSLQSVMLKQIGTIYFRIENYPRAYEYYELALKNYQIAGDKAGQAKLKNSFGMYYNAIGNYRKAVEFHTEGMRLSLQQNDMKEVAINYVNLGNAYSNLHEFDSALKYYNEALKIYSDAGYASGIATTYGNIGSVHLTKAETLRGNSLPFKQNAELAIRNLSMAYDKCKESGLLHPLSEFTESLSGAYALLGRNEEALNYLKEHMVVKDSMATIANLNKIAGLELTFQLKNKDKELQLKDKEIEIATLEVFRKQNHMIIANCIVVILVLSLVLVWRKLKRLSSRNTQLIKNLDDQISRTEQQMADLTRHSQVLSEIGYMQAHHIRGPVTTLLSMAEHFNREDYADPINKYLIENVELVTRKLDNAVQEVILKGHSVDNS